MVSVVMPIFNGEKYVEEMLDSLLKQTYRPLQIIVYDDGSRDRSLSVVRRWSEQQADPEVNIEIYASEINHGLRKATSAAVLYARGTYIFLADQDDVWLPDKIAVQVRYMEQNADCMACFCRRQIIDADGKLLVSHETIKNPVYRKKMGVGEVIAKPACFAANCMCLRNQHLDKIFPIDPGFTEHDSFITIMAAHFGSIVLLREVLIQYRIHKNNSSSAYFVESNSNPFRILKIKTAQLKREKISYRRDEAILKRVLAERFGEVYETVSGHYHREPVQHIWPFVLLWFSKRLLAGDVNRFYRKRV